MDALQLRALEQAKEAGRKGLIVERGRESVTQMRLVENGLLWQEHGPIGHWKFTLSPSGIRALAPDSAAPTAAEREAERETK